MVAGYIKPKSFTSVYVRWRYFCAFFSMFRDEAEAKTNCFLGPRHFPATWQGVSWGGAIVQKMNRGCWALGIGLHWWIGKGVALRWMSIAKTRKSDRPEEAHYSFFSQLFHFTPYKTYIIPTSEFRQMIIIFQHLHLCVYCIFKNR